MRVQKLRVRRVSAGMAMLLAGPLMLVSYLLWPAMLTDVEMFVADTVAVGRGAATASNLLGGLYFPAMVIAVMGLVHQLRDQRSALGDAAGGLAIVGLVFTTASLGLATVFLEVSFAEISLADKVAVIEASMSSGSVALLYAGPGLLAVGSALLGSALYRSSTIPRPSAVLFGLYGSMLAVGYATSSLWLVVAGFAAMTVALAPVGLVLLTESEAEWEHPPAFDGYRLQPSSRFT
jgi:hypothetical protein